MTKGPRRQFEHRRIRSAVIWKKDEKRQCILTILEWVERGGGVLARSYTRCWCGEILRLPPWRVVVVLFISVLLELGFKDV